MTLKRTDDPLHDLAALPADTGGCTVEGDLCPASSRQPSPPPKSSARRKLARTDSPQSMDLGSVASVLARPAD